MKQPKFGRCKGCGAQIIWIETLAGKMMPCDAYLIQYRVVPGGSLKVINEAGAVISAEVEQSVNKMDGVGYASHFSTCPMASKFRKVKGSK